MILSQGINELYASFIWLEYNISLNLQQIKLDTTQHNILHITQRNKLDIAQHNKLEID
jgi:hypothetical protein